MFPDGFEAKPVAIFFVAIALASIGLIISDFTRLIVLIVGAYWILQFARTYEDVMAASRRKYKDSK